MCPLSAQAESTLPLYDPSSDLCLFLCDDAGLKNEHAIGRVIVPIRDLCTQAPRGTGAGRASGIRTQQ